MLDFFVLLLQNKKKPIYNLYIGLIKKLLQFQIIYPVQLSFPKEIHFFQSDHKQKSQGKLDF